jgi:hypothetical protein
VGETTEANPFRQTWPGGFGGTVDYLLGGRSFGERFSCLLRDTMTGGQMANHTAKKICRMNRAIVDALVSAGEIAAEQADKWARRVAHDLVRNGMKVSKAIAALLR